MTAVRKRINRRRLEPLSEGQQRILSFQPFADALVERVITTTCVTGGEALTVFDAIEFLHGRMLAGDPQYARATEDERHGRQVSTAWDTALMSGIAVGRRLGPQPMKGGA